MIELLDMPLFEALAYLAGTISVGVSLPCLIVILFRLSKRACASRKVRRIDG